MNDVRLIRGDCLDVLRTLEDGSVDAVVTDPPYPEIDRPYGRWTEEEWFALMRPVVLECRRALKPTGSAVFVLQPNSERVGRMRPWLWDFLSWVSREWNVVQDVYWWNPTAMPTVHTGRRHGLMRPSVKPLVWVGPVDCWRDQGAVLWTQSDANKAIDRSQRALKYYPSGFSNRRGRQAAAADERGGTTPFNLIPIPNADSRNSAGAHGHGAGTPLKLCNWWVRYICPEGGTVLDPFMGSGTTGVACVQTGRKFIGIEINEDYFRIAEKRIAETQNATPLFSESLARSESER